MRRYVDVYDVIKDLEEYKIDPQYVVSEDEFFVNGYNTGLHTAICAVVEAKTVDAVKVVRCRDCIHYHEANNGCNGECDRQYATFYRWDYCSYGDKKEESNDGEPCKDCPHRAIDYVSAGVWCYCCHLNGVVLDKRVEKPEWCPLRKEDKISEIIESQDTGI